MSEIQPDARTGQSTRAARSIYLDALRAVALVRVVVYHVVGNEWLTMVAAMPIMFFVAGSLYAASLERRAGRVVIRDRYRRILLPYWVYIAAMIALWAWLGVLGELSPANWVGIVMPVLSLYGPEGPGAGTDLELTWIALWYLQFHLILSLIGPWLRRVQQRNATRMWIVIASLVAVSLIVGLGIIVPLVYISCWLLGYHHHDGDVEAFARRRGLVICAISGPVGAALYVAFIRSSEWSAISLRLAAVGALLIAAFWLTAAVALRQTVEPWLRPRPVHSTVNWFSQRSLSIYVWHMAVLYGVYELALAGSTSWPTRLAWVALGTLVAAVLTGWSEDLAARRQPTLWPRLNASR